MQFEVPVYVRVPYDMKLNRRTIDLLYEIIVYVQRVEKNITCCKIVI